MVKAQHTEYGNATAAYSTIHRTLGQGIFMVDADSIEYTYQNGTPHPVMWADYKRGTIQHIKIYPTIRAQKAFADQLDIPMFIILDYLHEPIPMYYLIPIGERAQVALREQDPWMSVMQFSKFQHHLRRLTFNEYNLSNEKATYPLPPIDLGEYSYG